MSKLIKNWEELKDLDNGKYVIHVEDNCRGHIEPKVETEETETDYAKHHAYLSTHTFYGSTIIMIVQKKGKINMLIPAISKCDEIEKLFMEHLYDDNMIFYTGYPYRNSLPDLTPKENLFNYAIINKDNEIVGFFSYQIERFSDNVWQFRLYSFKKDSTIGFDVYRKMKELMKNHRRIEWRMIGTNPVQRHYDNFVKHFDGNKIILHQVLKYNNKYLDEHIYEIVNSKV